MIEPREYQLEALDKIAEAKERGTTRALVTLPTGTGKTIVFALLAKENNVRTIIIAHTEELIAQAVAKLKVVWPEVDVGIVKAESDEKAAHVVVASIQTACRDNRLERLKEQNFGLMIIDEAHHAAAESYEKVVRELGFMGNNPEKLLVGLTATPKRGDGIGLGSVFQEIVFDRSISTMTRGGYLSPLEGKQVFTRVHLEDIGICNGDYISSELSNAVNVPSRNQLIIDNFLDFAADRIRGLAFCVDVQHAKDLANVFNANGIAAAAVYGDMDKAERKQTLSDFRIGKYRILTNCQLLTEGFDEPSIDVMILARPTTSSTVFIQQVGRGTRLHPGKRNCLVLDMVDVSSRHDLCTFKNTLDGAISILEPNGRQRDDEQWEEMSDGDFVDAGASNEAEVYQDRVEDFEFFETSNFAWVPVGDSWHLSLGADRDVWVRQINGGFLVVAQSDGDVFNLSNRPLPLDYALGVAEDWSRRQSTKNVWARKDAPWRNQPATSKQLETLTKLGIEFQWGISKGHAAQLLDQKINEPATEKQIWWLKSHGVKYDTGISKMNARKIIADASGGVVGK